MQGLGSRKVAAVGVMQYLDIQGRRRFAAFQWTSNLGTGVDVVGIEDQGAGSRAWLAGFRHSDLLEKVEPCGVNILLKKIVAQARVIISNWRRTT